MTHPCADGADAVDRSMAAELLVGHDTDIMNVALCKESIGFRQMDINSHGIGEDDAERGF